METKSSMDLMLAKKVYNSKKEFFLYKLNNENEVISYTLTNSLERYLKKYNFNYKLVDEMRVIIDKQLVIHIDESV